MTGRSSPRAPAAAAALAILTLTLAAAPAAARPAGPGDPAHPRFTDQSNCPLRRIDRQLVRCDNLTGAGVAAPLSVPEL